MNNSSGLNKGFKGGPVGVDSSPKGTSSSNAGSPFKGEAMGPGSAANPPVGKGKNNSHKGFLVSAVGNEPVNK